MTYRNIGLFPERREKERKREKKEESNINIKIYNSKMHKYL